MASLQKTENWFVFKTSYRLMQVKSIAECSNYTFKKWFLICADILPFIRKHSYLDKYCTIDGWLPLDGFTDSNLDACRKVGLEVKI